MGSFHRVRLSEFDRSSSRMVISGRLSEGKGTTIILASYHAGHSCKPLRIHDLGGYQNGARTKILLEKTYPNGALKREWIKFRESVDDLRHAFKVAGHNLPPVTKSILSRFRDIQPFIAVLR